MNASVQELADENLIEALREHARWQSPCECVEKDGLLMVAGANAFPIAFRNCIVRIDQRVSAQAALEAARDFFWSRNRGFTVLVRASRDKDIDERLRAMGIAPAAEVPCMLIESPVAQPAIPPGIRVQPFRETLHVQHAVQVNQEAYEAIKLPAQETRLFFGRPGALVSPRIAGYVAYRGNLPVSTALTLLSGKGAGVYWVGTILQAQRSGLADLCTRLATNAGFAAGASVVTLQASAYGEPLYRKLGYKTYDRLLRFRHPENVPK